MATIQRKTSAWCLVGRFDAANGNFTYVQRDGSQTTIPAATVTANYDVVDQLGISAAIRGRLRAGTSPLAEVGQAVAVIIDKIG